MAARKSETIVGVVVFSDLLKLNFKLAFLSLDPISGNDIKINAVFVIFYFMNKVLCDICGREFAARNILQHQVSCRQKNLGTGFLGFFYSAVGALVSFVKLVFSLAFYLLANLPILANMVFLFFVWSVLSQVSATLGQITFGDGGPIPPPLTFGAFAEGLAEKVPGGGAFFADILARADSLGSWVFDEWASPGSAPSSVPSSGSASSREFSEF